MITKKTTKTSQNKTVKSNTTAKTKVTQTKPKFDTTAFVFSYPIEDIKSWLDAFDSCCEDKEVEWPSQDECSVYCQLKKDYLTAISEGDTVILLNAIESRVTGLYEGKKKGGKK